MGVKFFKESVTRLICCGFAIAIAGMLCSCASTKMEYAKSVEMDAYPGPNLHGINRYLKENTIGSRLSGGLLSSELDHVSLHDVQNPEKYDSVEVSVKYRLNYLPAYGSIDKFAKGDLFLMSIGFGIYHGIYSSTSIGINTRYFELGLQSFQRFTYQTINYSGYEKDGDKFNLIEDTDHKNRLAFQYGAGAYAGLFIGPVTLAYNGNVYRPNKSIIIDKQTPEFPFSTPFLFTNNFSISYWYSPTTEFRLGLSNVLVDFNGGHWSLLGEVALWSF